MTQIQRQQTRHQVNDAAKRTQQATMTAKVTATSNVGAENVQRKVQQETRDRTDPLFAWMVLLCLFVCFARCRGF